MSMASEYRMRPVTTRVYVKLMRTSNIADIFLSLYPVKYIRLSFYVISTWS